MVWRESTTQWHTQRWVEHRPKLAWGRTDNQITTLLQSDLDSKVTSRLILGWVGIFHFPNLRICGIVNIPDDRKRYKGARGRSKIYNPVGEILMATKYYKEIIETAEGLRLIDDTLFRLVAEDIPACQEIIRELLDDSGIEVIKATPQRRLGGLNRNIIVDLLCKTSDGSYINVEVQTGDNQDDFRRTRLHASVITSHKTPKGIDSDDVPDVTILYIAEYDAAGRNRTVIRERHCLFDEDERIEVEDGETIIYATTAVNDGSSHSKLLQLFLRKDAFEDKDYPAISERMNYFKGTKEGRDSMCRAVEELGNKMAEEAIVNAIKNVMESLGVGIEKAMDILKISSEQRSMYAGMVQGK